MRGAFTAADARGTAVVVEIYSVLMLFSSLSRITAPAFYALKNTWLPAMIAFFVLLLHIAIGPTLVREYGLRGLAMATSFSSVLNIVVLQTFFYLLIGPLGYASIARSLVRLLPGLVALAAICHFVYPWLLSLCEPWASGHVARTLSLTGVIGAGMVVYFVVTAGCGSETSQRVFATIKRRLG